MPQKFHLMISLVVQKLTDRQIDRQTKSYSKQYHPHYAGGKIVYASWGLLTVINYWQKRTDKLLFHCFIIYQLWFAVQQTNTFLHQVKCKHSPLQAYMYINVAFSKQPQVFEKLYNIQNKLLKLLICCRYYYDYSLLSVPITHKFLGALNNSTIMVS